MFKWNAAQLKYACVKNTCRFAHVPKCVQILVSNPLFKCIPPTLRDILFLCILHLYGAYIVQET